MRQQACPQFAAGTVSHHQDVATQVGAVGEGQRDRTTWLSLANMGMTADLAKMDDVWRQVRQQGLAKAGSGQAEAADRQAWKLRAARDTLMGRCANSPYAIPTCRGDGDGQRPALVHPLVDACCCHCGMGR